MAFEEYIPSRITSKEPAVTISKSGLVSFNIASVEKHINNNKYAKLYYDSQTRRIGIKLLLDKEAHCLAIGGVKSTKRENATLSMKSFLNLYKILPMEKSMKGLPCVMDAALDMLIVQLPV